MRSCLDEEILPQRMLRIYHCKRCDHEWASKRKAKDIRVCPKCKSPYWNVEKKKKGKP